VDRAASSVANGAKARSEKADDVAAADKEVPRVEAREAAPKTSPADAKEGVRELVRVRVGQERPASSRAPAKPAEQSGAERNAPAKEGGEARQDGRPADAPDQLRAALKEQGRTPVPEGGARTTGRDALADRGETASAWAARGPQKAEQAAAGKSAVAAEVARRGQHAPLPDGQQPPADQALSRQAVAPMADLSGGALRAGSQGAGRQQGNAFGNAVSALRGAAGAEGPAASAGGPAEGIGGWRQYLARVASGQATVRNAVHQATARVRAELVQEARYAQRNGSSEMTVRLHPPELGRMKVELEMSDGKLDVRIRVENAEVRDAMRSELDGLGKTLRDAQMDVGRLEVGDYQGGWRDGRGAPLDQEGRSWTGPGGAEAAPDALGPAGWTVFTESGGVDCLV
jgi:flagellar hook-length control protein FliK